MITLRTILLLMSLVAPGAEHTGNAYPVALAVHQVVTLDPPPPGETSEQFAAELLVYAWEEGRYCGTCSRGDGGRAVCTAQVWARDARQARELEGSFFACMRAAGHILRLGARYCPANHGAPYCGGCKNAAAENIARRREEKARRMVAALHARDPT